MALDETFTPVAHLMTTNETEKRNAPGEGGMNAFALTLPGLSPNAN